MMKSPPKVLDQLDDRKSAASFFSSDSSYNLQVEMVCMKMESKLTKKIEEAKQQIIRADELNQCVSVIRENLKRLKGNQECILEFLVEEAEEQQQQEKINRERRRQQLKQQQQQQSKK
ncbi:Hypothetical_protein [Hexamita inflata]|uniref:Hypothetical_protein n=1 Tax=Hexamita inflata TaxID=28002 RepID=A0AA86Q3T4_9EUKA|nr:Hypothetical protein HINF_LOCUS24602 [Hexamita inflata]CAI9949012.1 Hypothetical protein HINF_LOCUS36657 [Hexamita inflata]